MGGLCKGNHIVWNEVKGVTMWGLVGKGTQRLTYSVSYIKIGLCRSKFIGVVEIIRSS